MKDRWESIHVFIRTNDLQEQLITFLGQTFEELKSENKINKWFFIRYWEGSPHIRVRFSGNCDRKIVQKKIQNFLKNHKEQSVDLDREIYYSKINFKAEGFKKESDLPWYAQGSIIPIEYKPEYERYGGTELMSLNETIFNISSNVAVNLLNYTKNNFSLRFILSIFMTKSLIQKLPNDFFPEGKLTFLSNCLSAWEKIEPDNIKFDQVSTFSIMLNKSDTFEKTATKIFSQDDSEEKIIKALVEIGSKLRKSEEISSIIFSQLHMTFNRLGIYPQLEKKVYPLVEGALINETN